MCCLLYFVLPKAVEAVARAARIIALPQGSIIMHVNNILSTLPSIIVTAVQL